MLAGLMRLLVRYLLLVVGIVLLNFLVPRLLPGDPLSFSAGEGTDASIPLSAAAREQLRSYYHLDEPLRHQLVLYLNDLGRGDLGWSIARPAPVSELILDRLPWTLALLLVSLLISASVGTTLGLVAGWAPGRIRDRLLVSTAAALAAMPEFLVAIGLLLAFAVKLGWFPLFGGQTVFAGQGSDAPSVARRAGDIVWHLALPAAALVVTAMSAFLLLARDATVGVRHEPWLMAARAKGLREREVARRHAMPNIALPLLTFFGLRLGSVLGGALVIERVFGVPGLGFLGYEAIRARDYPILQAVFLLSSLAVLSANLLVEILYLCLDWRRGHTRG
ncbi:MAG: ABC transporter permease [Chloroflexota bacterium]|nr:ABC transporter permease [Chloroflexota bacterium]MDP9470427.1 ABC transporter permease [Chloroflexota bacterium]